ncbi:putative bifunctional diguanylate cyclase/phosphodiesterase [Thiolapillus sp.]
MQEQTSSDNRLSDWQSDKTYGQIGLVFSSVSFSLKAILIVSLLLTAIQWEAIDHPTLILWFCGVILVSAFRLHQYRRFQAASHTPEYLDYWIRQAVLGAFLSGLQWAAAGVLLFTPDSMPHQLFLTFVIAGMAAGAVTTLSAYFPAVSIFLLVAIFPLSWSFFRLDTGMGDLMAGMLLFFAVLVIQAAHRLNTIITDALTMQHEKGIAEATMRRQALFDELTNLPNRRMLFTHLEQEISRSRRHGYFGAILFLDLDNFKNVNDSLGHALGDRLLTQVAARITLRLRKEDIAARLGGDEFVLLLSEIGRRSSTALAHVQRIASEIQGLFKEPFQVNGHTLHVTASIGIVLFPLDESSPGDLLQRADVAMYQAKEEGRDRFRFFQPAMQEALDRRLRIEKGLRRALDGNQLELYYQPQVDTGGKMIGAEALVRWRDPRRGIINPGEFIGIAEDTGLIYRLGDRVLCMACEHILKLAESSPLAVSVNISPRQFHEPAFVDRVKEIIEQYGIDPHFLHLEITESTVMDDIDKTIERMESIRSLGVTFAIDDFGTGQSSLAYLKRLPIETLKIDRSFVDDIEKASNDAVLVETIILMARHMGLKIIAEGVETRKSLSFLKEKGCNNFQGYLFSRPVPFQTLIRMDRQLSPCSGSRATG